MESILIPGCRHDILGYNLKAIGLLRTLAACATPGHRDTEAEGWWDMGSACFRVRSVKYPTESKLIDFFVGSYRPTPIFSPWNTGGGLDEKRELVLAIDRLPLDAFLRSNGAVLQQHGFVPSKHKWRDGKLRFDLNGEEFSLEATEDLQFRIELTSGRRPKKKVVIEWSPLARERLSKFIRDNLPRLEEAASIPKALREKLDRAEPTGDTVVLNIDSFNAANELEPIRGITKDIRVKTSGEKAILAVLDKLIASDADVISAIASGRKHFTLFQGAEAADQRREIFESFRDELPESGALAFDSVLTSRTGRVSNNPLFLKRGEAGNSEIFRSFWGYFVSFKDSANAAEMVRASLFSGRSTAWDKEKSPGAPFFPDAIKTYNNGMGWVVKTFPFNALDYLLAVEGALALRGAASRALAANSRRFAAFPFVFDSGEDLVDEDNNVTGTASSVWLPLWERPTSFLELESFICDAQARLPSKEARFSAEFARALRVQGVDAGFAGWQEFRFKMKASRVPWICTGRYIGSIPCVRPALLSDALAPLDQSAFLDQFELRWEGNKIDSRSPHPIRAEINSAIEDAVAEPTPENCLQVLTKIYGACRRLALSKTVRDSIAEARQRVIFFDALPHEPWERLLQGLDTLPEFRIARAFASIPGFTRQANGGFSDVQPFLGSLLPIMKGAGGWHLPGGTEGISKQAVWSGTDLCSDLSRVLFRRYLDSLKDDRPALVACRSAPLEDILAFLKCELDDYRIARWTEALSLIGWHRERNDEPAESTLPNERGLSTPNSEHSPAIPLAYAALRSLLDLECEWQGEDGSQWRKRRSHRPITLLCQRSPSSLALAVEDALRWLSVWGVPNCWGEAARREKPRLQGNDVIRIEHAVMSFDHDLRFVYRLAAAVAIPLDWRDRWRIFRFVTLPPTLRH